MPRLSTVSDPVEILRGYNINLSPSSNPIYRGSLHERHVNIVDGYEGNWGYPDFPDLKDRGNVFRMYGITRDLGNVGNPGTWYYRNTNTPSSRYEGELICNTTYSTLPVYQHVPDGSAWSAEAWSKMKPTKPEFSGLNFMYELREMPGLLRQRFKDLSLNKVGNFHLALQFGWGPLLSDVEKLYSLQKKIEKRYEQLLRDNGKPVRRRIELYDYESAETQQLDSYTYSAFWPVMNTAHYAWYPRHRRWDKTTEKVWASARFRYHLPRNIQGINYPRRLKAELYGLHPSPAVIYNAIPWSWLIDWFSNLGHVIDNLSAGVADRLAADYFYTMRQTTAEQRWLAEGGFNTWQKTFIQTATSTTSSFTRSRVKGNPFGVDVAQEDLSAMQLSILGALGISKVR